MTPIPLLSLFAASNEGPDDDSLQPLHDRFMFRHIVRYVRDQSNIQKMLFDSIGRRSNVFTFTQKTTIHLDELKACQQLTSLVKVPDTIIKVLMKLKIILEKNNLITSDRRWVNSLQVLQAVAVLAGRDEVIIDDIQSLKYCLWEKESDLDMLETELIKIVNPYEGDIKRLFVQAMEIQLNVYAPENVDKRANNAFEAKVKLEEIINRMKKVTNSAQKQGRNVDKFTQTITDIQAALDEIMVTCLGLNRGSGININPRPVSDTEFDEMVELIGTPF